jgi:hypothetical protein
MITPSQSLLENACSDAVVPILCEPLSDVVHAKTNLSSSKMSEQGS